MSDPGLDNEVTVMSKIHRVSVLMELTNVIGLKKQMETIQLGSLSIIREMVKEMMIQLNVGISKAIGKKHISYICIINYTHTLTDRERCSK